MGLANVWTAFPFLLLAAGVSALEQDDLRPGMKPDEVASVYTSLRSCSNALFIEGPDFMAWDAALFDRDARVEVRFGQSRASMIVIRIYLGQGDDGREVLSGLAEDNSRAAGPPEVDAAGVLVWRAPSISIKLSAGDTQDGREIRLEMTSLSSSE